MGRKRQTQITDPYYWSKRMSYERHKDSIRARTRHTQLGNDRRTWLGLSKRPYTNGICELCQGKVDRMHYHHWDDENPSLGLWLCPDCHRHAEGFDWALDRPDVLTRYADLKDSASRIYHESRLL